MLQRERQHIYEKRYRQRHLLQLRIQRQRRYSEEHNKQGYDKPSPCIDKQRISVDSLSDPWLRPPEGVLFAMEVSEVSAKSKGAGQVHLGCE